MSQTALTNLLNFDAAGLAGYFESIGERGFRATQIIKWVHQLGIVDFDAMTNLSRVLREHLQEHSEIRPPEIIAEQIRVCEIAAPPFGEEKRGLEFKNIFTKLGLQNVRIDKVGNVLGERPGTARRPHLVLAAHLDTVFPEGTNVKTTQEGTVIRGPGIG